MDRCEGQVEAAEPGDHFGSHAEIFVELCDEMPPAASEFHRKTRQIDMIRRILEYPPRVEQAGWRRRRGRQSCSEYVLDDVKAGCPIMCDLRTVREEARKSTVDVF